MVLLKNYKIYSFFIVTTVIFICCSYNQANEAETKINYINWSNTGYKNIHIDPITQKINRLVVPPPSNDPDVNYRNIIQKIKEASKKDGINSVILDNGTYNISTPIVFSFGMDGIVLKGSKNSEIKFIGKSNKAADIIKVMGKPSNWAVAEQISSYDDSTRTISLNKLLSNTSVGDYLEIRIPNGSWHDSKNHKSWNPQNYLGTIILITNIDKKTNTYFLNQSIQTEWELSRKENLKPQVAKFNPIKEIGIESLKLSTDNINNRQGFNINFSYAANCWVDNIESAYAASVHINIGNSTSIEVRNSTLHHAKDYGNPAVPEENLIAGTGYGVNVARSSNCLIENNTFYHLRHAMIIALGSNRNVFGYNHSYDQFSYPVKNLSDLNLHGHFPYNNLFEGNIVDRIHADQWWGSNGPNNTFLGNIVKKGKIKLEKTNDAHLINNEAEVDLIDSKVKMDTLEIDTLEKTSETDHAKVLRIKKISLYKNDDSQKK